VKTFHPHRTNGRDRPTTTITLSEGAAVVIVAGGAAALATMTNDVGPLLAFTGALLVAAVTWISTDRRQARQLAHQSERDTAMRDNDRNRLERQLEEQHAQLHAQLNAERDRQQAELMHHRELSDLDDLRKLLDEAAVALHEAEYAAMAVQGAHTIHGNRLVEEARDAVYNVTASGRSLDSLAARLAIRLGEDDRLSQTFDSANKWLLLLVRSMDQTPFDDLGTSDARNHGFVTAITGYRGYVRYFQRVAGQRVGATMPDFPEPTVPAEELVPPPADTLAVLKPQPIENDSRPKDI
jgi:hypothetical protein